MDDDLEEDLFDGAYAAGEDYQPRRGGVSAGKLLSRLVRIRKYGCRAALVGDEVRVAAIRELAQEAPTSKAPCSRWRMRVALSARTRRPASIPPLLLLGPPGIGKTHVAKRLAARHRSAIPAAVHEPEPCIRADGGLDLAWRGARPGKVAQALIETGPPRR